MKAPLSIRLSHASRRFFESHWWTGLSVIIVVWSLLVGNYANAIGHAVVYVIIRALFAWLRRTERKVDAMRAEVEEKQVGSLQAATSRELH